MTREKKKIISLSSVIAVLLIIMIVVTAITSRYKEYLDQFLGAGTQKVVGDTEGLSGDYIDFETTSATESRDLGAQLSLETAEEGIVLLRNDNDS